MNQADREQMLLEVEHKVGMVKTFHKDEAGADELIDLYEDYRENGASNTEIKLFLEDLNLFLESSK